MLSLFISLFKPLMMIVALTIETFGINIFLFGEVKKKLVMYLYVCIRINLIYSNLIGQFILVMVQYVCNT